MVAHEESIADEYPEFPYVAAESASGDGLEVAGLGQGLAAGVTMEGTV